MTDRPLEEEEYMCLNHLEYFKNKLLTSRKQLIKDIKLFLEDLREYETKATDILDQSNAQTKIFFDFGKKDRQTKLLYEIDLALARIESGEYGYCEITGDDIGLKRLEARPIATRCIEAQEQFERLTISRVRAAII
jgi:DnaK suppressor protein